MIVAVVHSSNQTTHRKTGKSLIYGCIPLDTYRMKSAFQMSSDRVNAYNALHVCPKHANVEESRYSNKIKISSSGKMAMVPLALRRSHAAVRPLPLGLTPSGWQGIVSLPVAIDSFKEACDVSLSFVISNTGIDFSPNRITGAVILSL